MPSPVCWLVGHSTSMSLVRVIAVHHFLQCL